MYIIYVIYMHVSADTLGPFFLEPNVAKLMAGFESFEGAFKSAWYTSCFVRTDSQKEFITTALLTHTCYADGDDSGSCSHTLHCA